MKQEDLLNFQEEEQKKDMKKPLIIGAVAFLVFVGGVIGYAVLGGEEKKENIVLPPKEVKEEKMFKEVPIETPKEEIKIKDIVKEEKVAPEPVAPEPKKEIPIQPPKKETPTIAQIEQKEIKRAEPKVEPKKEIKQKPVHNTKYYIQVLALLRHKAPDKNFLKLIKKEGFSYTFYRTYLEKNGEKIPVTKVLIGPFDDYQTAKRMLKVVREKITKHSFIFKVK